MSVFLLLSILSINDYSSNREIGSTIVALNLCYNFWVSHFRWLYRHDFFVTFTRPHSLFHSNTLGFFCSSFHIMIFQAAKIFFDLSNIVWNHENNLLQNVFMKDKLRWSWFPEICHTIKHSLVVVLIFWQCYFTLGMFWRCWCVNDRCRAIYANIDFDM